jgi:hypothetical protein
MKLEMLEMIIGDSGHPCFIPMDFCIGQLTGPFYHCVFVDACFYDSIDEVVRDVFIC